MAGLPIVRCLTAHRIAWLPDGTNDIFPSISDMRHGELRQMIGVLVFDDFQLLDATGPIAAFEIAYRLQRKRAADCRAGAEGRRGALVIRRRAERAQFQARAAGDADRRRRRGRARGRDLQSDAGVRALRRAPRQPRRQRLLRHLCAGRSWIARRQARDHALAADARFRRALSEGAARGGSHLRAGRQHLEFGRHHRGHRSGAGDDRRRVRRGDRAGDGTAARGLSPPLRRAVAVLGAAGTEIAERPLQAAARLGARASRRRI